MKHLFALTASVTACITAFAQPDFLYSNFPTATLNFTGYTITDPGSAQEPTPGAGQTWDLSAATFSQVGTLQITPAAGTPYAASYPTANWDFITLGTGMPADNMYLSVGTTGIDNVASHVPTAPNVYTDPQHILAFPLSFGNSYTDSYASTTNTGTETWTYSGAGTLITPEGTFTDQLMMTSTEGELVIWNASPIFPRFIVDDDGNTTLLVEGSSGIHEAADTTPLQIVPDPATHALHLTGMEGPYDWAITDMLGRILIRGYHDNATDGAIDVTSLTIGSYLMQVHDGATRRTVRFSKW